MIQLNDVFKFYKTKEQTRIILDHVSVVFESGWSYGVLGVNGAGKSTTMRMLAGTELPNSGRVRRTARVSWPLGFAGGFHPEMTGRENLSFVARCYGEDVQAVTRFVVDFAEIGTYIDAPVKTYSSGMMTRLAFGLSMAIPFEVYLIDEVTAVGDARFQRRCEEVFAKRRANADLIVISHSMATIKQYCQRGCVIVDGQIIMFENVDEAIDVYAKLNR
jgi:capsular polysaccharide transport system ATP-binding protein